MSVIAKFWCEKAQEGNVILRAVYTGSKENEEFFKMTPSGLIDLSIVNDEAIKTFEVGKEYYVTFENSERQ